MPAAYTVTISVQVSDFKDIGLLIQREHLLCGSCSSGQRFACGFLQILPRGRHPCRPANTSPCRACGGLAPPSGCALPGAPIKKGSLSRLPFSFNVSSKLLTFRILVPSPRTSHAVLLPFPHPGIPGQKGRLFQRQSEFRAEIGQGTTDGVPDG